MNVGTDLAKIKTLRKTEKQILFINETFILMFYHVTLLSRMWARMALHNFQAFLSIIKISFVLFPKPCSVNHINALSFLTIHNFLSLVDHSKFYIFVISPNPCYTNCLHTRVIYVSCPISVKFSKPSILIIYSRNFVHFF